MAARPLGMVERFTCDLILTDIDMPLMDDPGASGGPGPRASAQGSPVVVITKHTSEKGVEAGGQGLHSKALYRKGPLGKDRALTP